MTFHPKTRELPHDAFAEKLQAWIETHPRSADVEWGKYRWIGGPPIDDSDAMPW